MLSSLRLSLSLSLSLSFPASRQDDDDDAAAAAFRSVYTMEGEEHNEGRRERKERKGMTMAAMNQIRRGESSKSPSGERSRHSQVMELALPLVL